MSNENKNRVVSRSIEDWETFYNKWSEYFNEFMIKYNDQDLFNNPAKMRDMVDELSIQLGAFLGW